MRVWGCAIKNRVMQEETIHNNLEFSHQIEITEAKQRGAAQVSFESLK